MEHERFRSESIEKYAKFQVDLLKEILGKDSVIIHDFSGGYFDKSYDFSKVGKHMDEGIQQLSSMGWSKRTNSCMGDSLWP